MSELLNFIVGQGEEQFRRLYRQSARDEDRHVLMLTIDVEHVYHRFTQTSPFNATPIQMDFQQIRPPG